MTADQIINACCLILARGTKPTLPEVNPIVKAYYELDGNGAGGDLHVVLDDGNYHRSHIKWCIMAARDGESRALGFVLLMLSNSQRRRL